MDRLYRRPAPETDIDMDETARDHLSAIINHLAEATAGILEREMEITADGEIGQLQQLFNEMVLNMKFMRANLIEQNEKLVERAKKLRDAREQLIRREKLAVLGQLAGGVGHEIRNPLGVISNAVYYLKMVQPDADASIKEYLDTIESEVKRSTKIVSSLLDLSRTRPAEKEQIEISGLVALVLERHVQPENIEVIVEVQSDLPSVFVDSQQIVQVLNNLVINAYQAMPDGGKLTVNAKVTRGYPQISLTDTGCGIARENMAKLFEPLFTTKARGIGLGLAVAENLIKANDGSLEVESEEGKGSTFTVILPHLVPGGV